MAEWSQPWPRNAPATPPIMTGLLRYTISTVSRDQRGARVVLHPALVAGNETTSTAISHDDDAAHRTIPRTRVMLRRVRGQGSAGAVEESSGTPHRSCHAADTHGRLHDERPRLPGRGTKTVLFYWSRPNPATKRSSPIQRVLDITRHPNPSMSGSARGTRISAWRGSCRPGITVIDPRVAGPRVPGLAAAGRPDPDAVQLSRHQPLPWRI